MKKYYSKKEVEAILNRASDALSNLSIPKLVDIADMPAFNGPNTYFGWREYLLTGNIDNDFSKKAREQYSKRCWF